MKALCAILFILSALPIQAAQVVDFKQGDDRLQVYHGQTVYIRADSALVISMQRAALLNQKLLELHKLRRDNEQLKLVHQEILDKVREIERLTAQLVVKIERDKHAIQIDLNEIIAELDSSIVVLKNTNAELRASNEQLSEQLAEMERTIRHLKKQIRRLWWKSTADKMLVAVAAFGVGLAVGSM